MLALAAFAFVLCLCLPVRARAEGSLTVSAKMNPEAIIGPQKVEISIVLVNESSYALENLMLNTGGTKDYALLSYMEPGKRKSYTISNFTVDEYQLGGSIPLRFTYTENGQTKTIEYPLKVQLKAAEPEVLLTRTAAPETGKTGEEILLTYTLENTGGVDLMNLTLTDAAAGQEPIFQNAYLAIGEVQSYERTVILEQSLRSEPILQGLTPDGEAVQVSLDPLEILLAEPFMDVILTPGEQTSQGTPVSIVLHNTGNVDISAITVTDDKGSVLEDGLNLPAGEKYQIDAQISSSDSVRTLVITASGLAGTNEKVTFKSEGLVIEPLVRQPVELSITAQADKTQLEAAGNITLKVELTLSGDTELEEIIIREETAGVLRTLDRLEPGTTALEGITLKINQDSTLLLQVSAKDGQGQTYEATAQPITLQILESQVEAEIDPETAKAGNTLKLVLFGLVAALVIAAAALTALVVHERKNRARREEDETVAQSIRKAPKPPAAPAQRPQKTEKTPVPQAPAPQRASRRETFEAPQETARQPLRQTQNESGGQTLRTPLAGRPQPPAATPRFVTQPVQQPSQPSGGAADVPQSRDEGEDTLFQKEFLDD